MAEGNGCKKLESRAEREASHGSHILISKLTLADAMTFTTVASSKLGVFPLTPFIPLVATALVGILPHVIQVTK